jgi:hypothetical protein
VADRNPQTDLNPRRPEPVDRDAPRHELAPPPATRWRAIRVHDGLSRARIRTDYTWSGSAWAVAGETRYLYDSRRVIQKHDSSNTPKGTCTRGPDLSGSFEGEGGANNKRI